MALQPIVPSCTHHPESDADRCGRCDECFACLCCCTNPPVAVCPLQTTICPVDWTQRRDRGSGIPLRFRCTQMGWVSPIATCRAVAVQRSEPPIQTKMADARFGSGVWLRRCGVSDGHSLRVGHSVSEREKEREGAGQGREGGREGALGGGIVRRERWGGSVTSTGRSAGIRCPATLCLVHAYGVGCPPS